MAKIFNGKVLFASAMQPTGAQPLDDRVVVQSYSDLVDVTTFGDAKYLGMIVGVVDDSKLYMLTNTDVTAEGAWKEIGAGGAVSVETYAEAVALATDENIGQVIYVKTKSSYNADGEGEGAAVEYDAAPYIVIGEGVLQKLAASTASGDIEGDVAKLTTKVSELETTVGNAESGLVKDVADLKDAMDALPETFVTDVKVGETSLVADGVADLSNFVQKDGDKVLSTNDYTTADKDKLAGIAAGAEVNVVKSVDTTGALGLDETGKLSADLSAYALSTTIDSSLAKKVDVVEGKSLVDDTLIIKLDNMTEIKSVGDNLDVDTDGKLTVDLSGKVDVVEGKGLSTNDFTNDLKTKLDGIAAGAEVNYVKSVGANLSVSEAGELTVDLSALATTESLNDGLATKLDASAKVNGVSFTNGEATLDAADIKLNAVIGKKEVDGSQVDRYTTANDIQYVLNDIDTRIDAINTTIDNVTGGGVIADITAGDGINVDKTTKTNPTVSVKVDELSVKIDSNAKVALNISAKENQMLEVKTDGVYVQDMRSYWEAI